MDQDDCIDLHERLVRLETKMNIIGAIAAISLAAALATLISVIH